MHSFHNTLSMSFLKTLCFFQWKSPIYKSCPARDQQITVIYILWLSHRWLLWYKHSLMEKSFVHLVMGYFCMCCKVTEVTGHSQAALQSWCEGHSSPNKELRLIPFPLFFGTVCIKMGLSVVCRFGGMRLQNRQNQCLQILPWNGEGGQSTDF